ncbi:hypothetical protein P4S72_24955 [Vibrio sp. PP-XX7]
MGTCIPAFSHIAGECAGIWFWQGMAETLLSLSAVLLGLFAAAFSGIRTNESGGFGWINCMDVFPIAISQDAPVSEHQMPPVTTVEKQLISLLFICSDMLAASEPAFTMCHRVG